MTPGDRAIFETCRVDALTIGALIAKLVDRGLTAEVERGESLEDLGQLIEHGYHVIAHVNGGFLWELPDEVGWGEADRLVMVVAVAREELGGRCVGFTVADPHLAGDPREIDADAMERAWLETGGRTVVALPAEEIDIKSPQAL